MEDLPKRLATSKNQYGVPIAVYKCAACGREFTVCPAPDKDDGWESCLADNCPSYDPKRDAEILFMSGKEIRETKPVVSIEMLRARKKSQQLLLSV